MKTIHQFFAVSAFTLGLLACGGSDNNTAQTPTTPSESPEAALTINSEVLFPTPVSYSEEPVLTLRGTASDDNHTITSVSVNGVAATSSDNFATWQATVPLNKLGDNTLTVSVSNDNGQTHNATSVTVKYAPAATVRDVTTHASSNRLWFLTTGQDIYEVDLTTNAIKTVAGPNKGIGPSYAVTARLAVSDDGNTLYISDPLNFAISAVNLLSGQRYFVSNSATGTGTDFTDPGGIDVKGTTAYVADTSADRIFSVDLTTGDRTVIADGTSIGSGATVLEPTDVYINDLADTLYVVDRGTDKLYSIDINSGVRTNISAPNLLPTALGSGPVFSGAESLTVNAAEDTAYITDTLNDGVMSIDLSTGDRAMVTDNTATASPDLTDPAHLALVDDQFFISKLSGTDLGLQTYTLGDTDRSRYAYPSAGAGHALGSIYGIDTAPNGRFALFTIVAGSTGNVVYLDLTTGDRILVSDNSINPANGAPFGVIISPESDSAYIPSRTTDNIYRLDLDNDTVEVISSSTVGTGNNFNNAINQDVDFASGKIWAVDNPNRIWEVDIDTGDRTEISCYNIMGCPDSVPPATFAPQDVKADLANNRLLVSLYGQNALIEVDLNTGERNVVSDDSVGSGTNLNLARQLSVDSANNQAWVMSRGNGLIHVDLNTGDRTGLFSKSNTRINLTDFYGVAVDPAAELSFLTSLSTTETGTGAVILVDLVTNAHVYLAL